MLKSLITDKHEDNHLNYPFKLKGNDLIIS